MFKVINFISHVVRQKFKKIIFIEKFSYKLENGQSCEERIKFLKAGIILKCSAIYLRPI